MKISRVFEVWKEDKRWSSKSGRGYLTRIVMCLDYITRDGHCVCTKIKIRKRG